MSLQYPHNLLCVAFLEELFDSTNVHIQSIHHVCLYSTNVHIQSIHHVCLLQLMYFAAESDPLEGFLRALSIATGQAMPSTHDLPYISVMSDGSDMSPNMQVRKTQK